MPSDLGTSSRALDTELLFRRCLEVPQRVDVPPDLRYLVLGVGPREQSPWETGMRTVGVRGARSACFCRLFEGKPAVCSAVMFLDGTGRASGSDVRFFCSAFVSVDGPAVTIVQGWGLWRTLPSVRPSIHLSLLFGRARGLPCGDVRLLVPRLAEETSKCLPEYLLVPPNQMAVSSVKVSSSSRTS